MGDYIEIGLRWIFGLQMVFWGLNGFFNWIKMPPASPVIERFVQACIESRFIMFSVKMVEIIFGVFLLLGFVVPFSLLVFAPLLFVISGLHSLHNPKPWGILISYTLPYTILLLIHSSTLLRLFH
jgi:uncharacterized membrane protein YphA (DoxX/SURF4 family)